MKGGKAGRSRTSKSGSNISGRKGPGRSGVKKSAAKRDWSGPPVKSMKKTTKLGAVRLPDDE